MHLGVILLLVRVLYVLQYFLHFQSGCSLQDGQTLDFALTQGCEWKYMPFSPGYALNHTLSCSTLKHMLTYIYIHEKTCMIYIYIYIHTWIYKPSYTKRSASDSSHKPVEMRIYLYTQRTLSGGEGREGLVVSTARLGDK